MKILCVSDTHNDPPHPKGLPDADVLIHSGDATYHGREEELVDFNDWLVRVPIKHKIFVPGNHDLMFERDPERARSLVTEAIVLIHEAVEIDGVDFFGSPWTPWFHHWAFNYRADKAESLWEAIPEDTDVLITHGPPLGVLDLVARDQCNVGCPVLLDEVLNRVQPVLHVFGHIHEGAGLLQTEHTLFVNAASLNEQYQPRPRGWTLVTI